MVLIVQQPLKGYRVEIKRHLQKSVNGWKDRHLHRLHSRCFRPPRYSLSGEWQLNWKQDQNYKLQLLLSDWLVWLAWLALPDTQPTRHHPLLSVLTIWRWWCDVYVQLELEFWGGCEWGLHWGGLARMLDGWWVAWWCGVFRHFQRAKNRSISKWNDKCKIGWLCISTWAVVKWLMYLSE